MMHAPNEHRSLLVEIDVGGEKGLAGRKGSRRMASRGESSAVAILFLVGMALQPKLN